MGFPFGSEPSQTSNECLIGEVRDQLYGMPFVSKLSIKISKQVKAKLLNLIDQTIESLIDCSINQTLINQWNQRNHAAGANQTMPQGRVSSQSATPRRSWQPLSRFKK